MSIGQGRRGNQVAGAKEVIGRRDVVTRFVPVVRQAQQRQVGQVYAHEEQREDQPQWNWPVELCWMLAHESVLLSPG